jgi:2-oxoglutarate ferredoxin oxidoreductase subunit alpha
MMLNVNVLNRHNFDLQKKYDEIAEKETRWQTLYTDDAEMVVVAYGSAAQIAESAIEEIRAEGIAAGLFRPITVWPYPTEALRALSKRIKKIAVFEFSMGQMLEDVILSVGERAEITFYGIPGGIIPTPAEVAEFLRSVLRGDGKIGRRVLV